MAVSKPYIYQRHKTYFASVCDGVEGLLRDELLELGADKARTEYRGVAFTADRETLYRINYSSCLATRIYAPLKKFDCHSTKYLYRTAVRMRWEDFFSVKGTFAINSTVSHSAVRHSKYAALCLKDAIADSFRNTYNKRPSVDTERPDIWFNLHIQENRALISIDTSGGSLHRRSYRVAEVEAPMQESVAAAIIRLSGWQGDRPLYDPLCGGGTLLSEALLSACRIPPAWKRKHFGFEHLPDYDPKCWGQVKKRADGAMREIPGGLLAGSDKNPSAVKIAVSNLRQIPWGDKVKLVAGEFQSLRPMNNCVLICNPPYGQRMGNRKQAANIYKQLAYFLRKCRSSEAYVYFGNGELVRSLPLEPVWSKPLKNGGLKGRLVKYSIPQ